MARAGMGSGVGMGVSSLEMPSLTKAKVARLAMAAVFD